MTATAPSKLKLRTFDPSDFPIVWSWIGKNYWKVADDYSPKTMREFVDSQIERGSKNLGVYSGNELVGMLVCDPLSPVVCEGHAYFKRSFLGRENTAPAVWMGIQWAFDQGFKKMTSPVFERNRLMVRLLTQLGGVQEGFFRGHTTQQGKPVNVLYFSFFKEG